MNDIVENIKSSIITTGEINIMIDETLLIITKALIIAIETALVISQSWGLINE